MPDASVKLVVGAHRVSALVGELDDVVAGVVDIVDVVAAGSRA